MYTTGKMTTPQRELDAAQSILVVAELLKAQEGYDAYDALQAGIDELDRIIPAAKKKVNEELCDHFAELCQKHDFLYILGSGACFAQTYGFAICSLMEMQWQNCCYIHSAEYFHGPFECTEPGVFYFLQMSSGPSLLRTSALLHSSTPIPTPLWFSMRSSMVWTQWTSVFALILSPS